MFRYIIPLTIAVALYASGPGEAHPTGYGHIHVTDEQCEAAEASGLFKCVRPEVEAGKDGPNQRKNRQVRDVANRLGLDDDEEAMLHDEIHGWDYSYDEIMEVARDMFGK